MLTLLHESGLTEDDYPATVAARIALKIGFYSPRRWAGSIECPVLVQIVAQDTITPRRVAESAAARIPNSIVRMYDGGHFDPYVEPLFSTVVADQVEFLHRHVPRSRATTRSSVPNRSPPERAGPETTPNAGRSEQASTVTPCHELHAPDEQGDQGVSPEQADRGARCLTGAAPCCRATSRPSSGRGRRCGSDTGPRNCP